MSKFGGVTGKGWKPGQSGNPNGRPRRPITLLSDALQRELDKHPGGDARTCAELISRGFVECCAMVVKRCLAEGKLSRELLAAIVILRDTVEGRPAQRILLEDDPPTAEEAAARIRELIAIAQARSVDSNDGTTALS